MGFWLIHYIGHEDKLLRSLILNLLGEFEDKATVSEAEMRLEAHRNGSSPLPPDLRSVVYTIVLSNADVDSYKSALKVQLLVNSPILC